MFLNLFKDSLTLIGLLGVMFYQNWKLSLLAIIMIPLASFFASHLGKRVKKVTTQVMDKAGVLNTYLLEIVEYNTKTIAISDFVNYDKNIYYLR